MADNTGNLRTRTKIFYGIGDLGNALVNSAIQFFLMKFYYPITRRSRAKVRRKLEELDQASQKEPKEEIR
jgi:hypothetical protein